MRDCENADLRDLLPDLVGERLSGADRARVAAHAVACPACTAELAVLRAANDLLRRSAPVIDVGRIVAALPSAPGGVQSPTLIHGSSSTTPSLAAGHGAGARTTTATATATATAIAARRRPTWTAWRLAAAISTIAVGALSVAVLRGVRSPNEVSLTTSEGPGLGSPDTHVGPAAIGTQPVTAGSSGVSMPGPLPNHRPAGSGVSSPSSSPGGGEPANTAAPSAALPSGSVSDLSDGEVEGLLRDLDDLEATPSADPEPAAPGLHEMATP